MLAVRSDRLLFQFHLRALLRRRRECGEYVRLFAVRMGQEKRSLIHLSRTAGIVNLGLRFGERFKTGNRRAAENAA